MIFKLSGPADSGDRDELFLEDPPANPEGNRENHGETLKVQPRRGKP